MADLNNDILWIVGQYVTTIRNKDKIEGLFNIMPSETMIENKVFMLKKMTVPELKEQFKLKYSYDGRVQNDKTFKFYKEIQTQNSIYVKRRNKHHYMLELLNGWIETTIKIKKLYLSKDSIYSNKHFKKFYEIIDGVTYKYTPEEKDALFNKKCNREVPEVIEWVDHLKLCIDHSTQDGILEMNEYWQTAITNVRRKMRDNMVNEAHIWQSKLKRNKRKDIMRIKIKWDIINDGVMIRHYGGL